MHAKAWLPHCSQSCHPRSAARQGWVCLSDIPCSRCPRSWSAADSPNLCTNLKLRVHQLDNIVVHTVSFVFIDVELTTPEGVHWRKSTRKWPVSGPVLEGRGACRSKVLQHSMPSCQEELLRLTDLLTKKMERDGAPFHWIILFFNKSREGLEF